MTKTFIWLGLLVGSTVGGFVPMLWGGDLLSAAGILLSAVGGIAGIFAGYKLAQSVG
ncbi:MAG TPA: hypothetical protein VIF62_06905 [Labilithrix sp.]|jgi:hypothetical protein